MKKQDPNIPFELGTWLGRRQAFGWIASKCSAVDAECLRVIRDKQLYRALDLSWDQFCSRHAGLNRRTADAIINRLAEFGASYFQLSQILHISEPEYRAIAPAIENEAIEFEGERVSITRENADRIAHIVSALRKAARPAPKPRTQAVAARLDGCLGEICGFMRRGLRESERLELIALLDDAARTVEELRQAVQILEPAA